MEYIIAEEQNNTGIITLNRPAALNAVCLDMLKEIAAQVELYGQDEGIGAIILRGSDKAFAAGIDLNEINDQRRKPALFGRVYAGL